MGFLNLFSALRILLRIVYKAISSVWKVIKYSWKLIGWLWAILQFSWSTMFSVTRGLITSVKKANPLGGIIPDTYKMAIASIGMSIFIAGTAMNSGIIQEFIVTLFLFSVYYLYRKPVPSAAIGSGMYFVSVIVLFTPFPSLALFTLIGGYLCNRHARKKDAWRKPVPGKPGWYYNPKKIRFRYSIVLENCRLRITDSFRKYLHCQAVTESFLI